MSPQREISNFVFDCQGNTIPICFIEDSIIWNDCQEFFFGLLVISRCFSEYSSESLRWYKKETLLTGWALDLPDI